MRDTLHFYRLSEKLPEDGQHILLLMTNSGLRVWIRPVKVSFSDNRNFIITESSEGNCLTIPLNTGNFRLDDLHGYPIKSAEIPATQKDLESEDTLEYSHILYRKGTCWCIICPE
jgi:hypothetical protein